MKGCPTDKLKFETPILITVFSGRRRDIGHARSALESIHTRDHCPLGQCHYPLSSLKIWELQERRELPLLLGNSGHSLLSDPMEVAMVFTPMRAICVVTVQLVIATLAQSVSAQETTKGLLAVQARAQGYRCDNPISAKRDEKRSRPDASFWVLRCERNSYTMRLTPDMAAHIQRLK
jgi:hypothetical protein